MSTVHVVSHQQAKAARKLFNTLSTIELDFHDKKLGPTQVNDTPGAPGMKSLADFTALRHSIDQTCHTGMKYDLASAGIKTIPERYEKYVTTPEKTKNPAVDRWAATRVRIRDVYRHEETSSRVIGDLDKLLGVLKDDINNVLAAFATTAVQTKFPEKDVVTRTNKYPEAYKYKPWEPEV